MTQDLKTPMPPAAAAPTASGRRFLAQLMEHAFREGWRTSEDFVKHFPAHTIMGALKSAPELRVAILAAATGIYEEILRRKTPALAAEDLRVALEEGTTTSQELLQVFSPEDRVRYLDAHRLWDFLAEDRFWELDADATEDQRRAAIDRMIFTLTQALSERLITLRDVLDGLTYDAVADSLSPQELRNVVRHALVKGRDNIGLNEKVLLEVLPLEKLVRSVPLEHIWHEVVIRRLAMPSGLTDLSREERRTSQAEKRGQSEKRRWPSRPPPPATAAAVDMTRSFPDPSIADHQVTAPPPYSPAEEYGVSPYGEEDALTAVPPAAALRESNALPPPPPRAGAPGGATASPLPGFASPSPMNASAASAGYPQGALLAPSASSGMDGEHGGSPAYQPLMTLPQPAPGASRPLASGSLDAPSSDAAERQRQRVTEHLRAIGRLPPNHATLPAAVLRSIDAMYALLPSATDDIQRKSVIRQAFSSENYLRMALLGLIELMDSSVDTSDPVIQEAKIEALVKILLFEEQRRKETGRFPPSQMGGRGPSSRPASSSSGASGAYYYPPPAPPSHPLNPAAVPPHVPTERPPPPVLTAVPAYGPGPAAPPLPNIPADPTQTRRRTVPPPLPPSYPRG